MWFDDCLNRILGFEDFGDSGGSWRYVSMVSYEQKPFFTNQMVGDKAQVLKLSVEAQVL